MLPIESIVSMAPPGLRPRANAGASFVPLTALCVIDSRDRQMISLGAATLVGARRPIDWTIAAAGDIVTVVPIFSIFVPRYIVRGLSAGAVK